MLVLMLTALAAGASGQSGAKSGECTVTIKVSTGVQAGDGTVQVSGF